MKLITLKKPTLVGEMTNPHNKGDLLQSSGTNTSYWRNYAGAFILLHAQKKEKEKLIRLAKK